MGITPPKQFPLVTKDEGVTIADKTLSLNFVGANVAGSVIGNDVTETIGGVPGTPVNSEVPTGAINGVNTVFTLANTPLAGTLKLYAGGARMTVVEDFTLVGATITFLVAPFSGTVLIADYSY